MEPGENTSSKNGKATSEVSHNIDCSYCGWCQLDLDNSNNPHIAFFDISDVFFFSSHKGLKLINTFLTCKLFDKNGGMGVIGIKKV